MNPLISIIVPVYNVEDYLTECVHSILSQTYQNIEVILVDDGSPDRCPELCDKLAQKYDKISVVHQKNAGLSAARNAGIRVARGELIGFVDSDDTIHTNMYEKLADMLVKENADLAICDFQLIDPQGNFIEDYSPIKSEMLSAEEAYTRILGDEGYWHYVTAVNKLYKKSIFDELSFEEGKLHEDEYAIHHVLSKCNRIVTIPDKLYYYLKRDNSITTSTVTGKNLDVVCALHDRYLFFKSKNMEWCAHKTALMLCGVFLVLLAKIDMHQYRDSVEAAFKIVLRDMIDVHEIRTVKLILKYLLKCVELFKIRN